MENEAINDIIIEMTKFEEMKKLNEWGNEKNKLYIISKLDTFTAGIIEPTSYDIGSNGINYSQERIEENKREFEENLKKYELEEKLFSELIKGKIKIRNLNYYFKNEKLNIELMKREIFEELENIETKKNEFGYLFISRIVFNKNFTKGYLHFDFYCEVGCGWNSNIEIKRINGKWKITEYFSGGVA
jgi:hypothetical protein